jgi:DNA-binding CsgD family transcriptional regulator
MAILRSLPDLAGRRSIRRLARVQAVATAGDSECDDLAEAADQRPLHLLMAGFEALDLINVGLMVSNASGQLLLANQTAEQILEARDGLETTARGSVRTSTKCNPSLSVLMEQAAKSDPSGTLDSILAVERPSGKRPLTLLIRAVDGVASNHDPMAPSALVFILDPEFPVATAEDELRQLYGLTSMEACLANLLMEGKTLDECCEFLGTRRSTVRTHLQHLFEKVGVQRQSELVSLLLKSIGLVRTATKAKTRGKSR